MMSRTVRKVVIKESTGRKIIEQSRIRLLCVGLFFALCFGSISARMIDVAVIDNPKLATITVSDCNLKRFSRWRGGLLYIQYIRYTGNAEAACKGSACIKCCF